MKSRLRELLVCPRCKGDLRLFVEAASGDAVMAGRFECAECGGGYPIQRGVPRFVRDDAYAASFGYEWHRFRQVQIDSANNDRDSDVGFRAKTGLRPEAARGCLVLDAGVGAGRYAEVLADWGAEVVGVDLTHAVDAAFENIGQRPNVHLVQADIFALPFRDATFDLAYSIGVLHHTPDTEEAFKRVAVMVKKGGQLAVYVYHAGGLARYSSDLIRTVTTRLPRSAVYWGSTVAVPLYYPFRLPGVGRVLQSLLPISMYPKWRWRWLDTFDWYSPRYQWKHKYPEVIRWFQAAGFRVMHVADEPICVRGLKDGD